MPDVNEAFVAEFTFSSASPLEKPKKQYGLEPPPAFGEGRRCKSFRWRCQNPDDHNIFTSIDGDRISVGARQRNPGQYPANGNPLTIVVVGEKPGSRITAPEVQVSARTESIYHHIPFQSHLWTAYLPGSPTWPVNGPDKQLTVFTSPATFELVPDKDGTPHCPLLTLIFAPDIARYASGHRRLFLDIAIYLEIDGLKYFDDPEMEIDLGSGDC